MARQSSWASPLCCFCLLFWLNARGERQCHSPKGSPLFHTLSNTREHLVTVSGSPLLGYFSRTCFPVQSCSRGSVNQRAFASLSGDGDFPAPILTSLLCSSIGVWSSAHFPQHPSVTFLLRLSISKGSLPLLCIFQKPCFVNSEFLGYLRK